MCGTCGYTGSKNRLNDIHKGSAPLVQHAWVLNMPGFLFKNHDYNYTFFTTGHPFIVSRVNTDRPDVILPIKKEFFDGTLPSAEKMITPHVRCTCTFEMINIS